MTLTVIIICGSKQYYFKVPGVGCDGAANASPLACRRVTKG